MRKINRAYFLGFKSLSLIDMERITEFYVQAQAFKECTSMFRAVFEKNPVMLKVLLDQISKKRNTTHYYEYTSEAGPPCINGNTALHSIILVCFLNHFIQFSFLVW